VSKFTVIDGDGPRGPREPEDPHADSVRYHFRRLAVELLRALARGDDHGGRLFGEIISFINHAAELNRPPLGMLMAEVFQDLGKEISPESKKRYEAELDTVVLAALRVAAETWTDDGFTRARLSDRRQELGREIEDYVVEHERRSRENGWSYLGKLINDRFPPPRKLSAREKKTEAKRAFESRLRLDQALASLKKPRKDKGIGPDDD
jgi:hypothetical protein